MLVDVYVTGDVARAADELRALGMRVSAVSDRAPERMVEGYLPADALAAAAALGATHAIVSTIARVDAGSVISQGDAAIDGPQARALGATGTGASVGIISDSINEIGGGIAASQTSGNLPATVDDLLDDPNGVDEGRAMAEVVYDEAPGITHMAFSSGTLGPASKAASIDNLVSDGVTAIADDIEWLTEPYFQDDIIAQAVDRAKAAGVAYFASAANDANQSWQGTYAPVADPTLQSATTENFDPGGGVDTVQSVGTIPANGSVYLGLQWAEPWGRATTDLALDVYRFVGGVPVFDFTTDTDNIATGIPMEIAEIDAGSSPLTFGIAIRRVAGTGTPFMKYIDFTNGVGTVSIEHATNSGAIAPDAGSASGALTVAASNYTVRTTPEPFSSRGPVIHLFDANGTALSTPDVRQKPNLAGPDGVSTSVPVSGLSTFFGTSAAAPAAAGIAALIRSARPAMPVDELYAIMTNPANALDCTAPGNPDLDCGVGFELADRAVTQALDSTPPAIAPTVVPATPDGPNGWYHGPVSVTWNVSDAESPVVDPAGLRPREPERGCSHHADVHGNECRRDDVDPAARQARFLTAEHPGARGRLERDVHRRDAATGCGDRLQRERSDLRDRQLHGVGVRLESRPAHADGDRHRRRGTHRDEHAHLHRLDEIDPDRPDEPRWNARRDGCTPEPGREAGRGLTAGVRDGPEARGGRKVGPPDHAACQQAGDACRRHARRARAEIIRPRHPLHRPGRSDTDGRCGNGASTDQVDGGGEATPENAREGDAEGLRPRRRRRRDRGTVAALDDRPPLAGAGLVAPDRYSTRASVGSGDQAQSDAAFASASLPHRANAASCMRHTGMCTPWKHTEVFALLAHSTSSRHPCRAAAGRA